MLFRVIGRKGSAVIGIEGARGRGKPASWICCARRWRKQKEDRTYVLSISPWRWRWYVSGGVFAASVASIIATEEERLLPAGELAELKRKGADQYRPDADGLYPGHRTEPVTSC